MDSEPAVQTRNGPTLYGVPNTNISMLNPSTVLVSHAQALSLASLISWSQYIRDEMLPLLSNTDDIVDPESTVLSNLRAFFTDLAITPIGYATLCRSRIHNALKEILQLDGMWPEDVKLQAGHQLSLWEARFGSMTKIRADPWGLGGRLTGCTKLLSERERQELIGHGGDVQKFLSANPKKVAWAVSNGANPLKPFTTGHNGCEVGNWWIKPVAAFRDGMIHASSRGITADTFGAYAVLVTGDNESNVDFDKASIVKYRPSVSDPAKFKLMKNLTSYKPVRVLRTAKCHSIWKPVVGVRYDGLYRVVGYGVHLVPATGNNDDKWEYTFSLKREPGQPHLDKALIHPTQNEMDDWNDYQKLKVRRKVVILGEERRLSSSMSNELSATQFSADGGRSTLQARRERRERSVSPLASASWTINTPRGRSKSVREPHQS